MPTPIERVVMDVDGDGTITLAEVSSWPSAAFFLPGDGLLWATATYAPPIARLLDVGPADYGGLLSGTLSTFAWIAALIGGAILYQQVRDVDRRLTHATVRAYSTGALRLRIARVLLLQRWREWWARRARSSSVEVSTDIALSAIQLKTLRLHAKLPAGYVRSVSEVARGLGASVDAAEKVLGELRGLSLLIRASCGVDGESGYALSAGGRALLDFHERAAATPERTARAKPSAHSGAPARERLDARARAERAPR